MKLNIEPIKSWFGFTRRERSAAFILLLSIVCIILLRYAVPEKNIVIEDITASVSYMAGTTGLSGMNDLSKAQYFAFDPNNASYDTLIQLGLSSKEANTLINYRDKGGIFRKSSDIKKIYGIAESKAEELIPFIEIKPDAVGKVKVTYDREPQTLIDLNRCDSAILEQLPGIGPVLSIRIIKFRNLLGGFAMIEQLKEVYGLPEETYNRIKPRFFIDTTAIIRIKVNSAEYNEWTRLPYFEKYEIAAILKYRELKGRVTGINDLTDNKLITIAKAAKVRPYLNFE